MTALLLRVTALLIASNLLQVQSSPAQQPRADPAPRRLTAKPHEFPEPFSSVRSLTALPDGRLVVSDAIEKRVLLLDYTKGTLTPLARTGRGPREYQAPGGTYRAARGGVLVYDQSEQRFLPITPTGQVLDVMRLAIQATSTNVSDEGPDQFAVDTLGNTYTVGQRHGASGARDSVPFLHVSPRRAGTDTIGFLQLQESRSVPSSTPNVILGRIVAFSPQDVWAVAPDGSVAIVKAEPYRIDWYSPSAPLVRGPVIPHTPLEVTAADRDALRANMRGVPPPRVSINGQPGTNLARPATEPLTRDVKPPFPPQVPRIDEQGRLWVERSRAASAKHRIYDVINRRGILVDRIELPEGSRLVGFDARALYAVRTDGDDLLHLQRFSLP